METKKPWESKTIIFGFITALAGALGMLIPALSAVQPFMTKNEALLSMAWGVLAMALRAISKDKIQLGN